MISNIATRQARPAAAISMARHRPAPLQRCKVATAASVPSTNTRCVVRGSCAGLARPLPPSPRPASSTLPGAGATAGRATPLWSVFGSSSPVPLLYAVPKRRASGAGRPRPRPSPVGMRSQLRGRSPPPRASAGHLCAPGWPSSAGECNVGCLQCAAGSWCSLFDGGRVVLGCRASLCFGSLQHVGAHRKNTRQPQPPPLAPHAPPCSLLP